MDAKTKIFISFILICGFTLMAAADPFYIRMLEQGKGFYFDNQFEKALENLRIAEFGLLMEKDYIQEIFIFQSLCYFKLKKTSEAQEKLQKIEKELKVINISTLEFSPEIQKDVDILLSIFRKGQPKKTAGIAQLPEKNITLESSFASIFSSAREFIQSSQFDQAEAEIKKLRRINKKDIRIDYLQSRICFEKKKYPDCIQGLRKVYEANSPEFRDEVLYYLVISYYFVGNFGQALAFFHKIENPADKQKLDAIIEKVKSERERLIGQVASAFSQNAFKQLADAFAGDNAVANDVLTRAQNTFELNNPVILDIIEAGNGRSQACNRDFFLNASDYYKKIKKIKQAIALLKNSRYYREKKEENVEIFYQIGIIYFQMKEWSKALVELAKVRAIHPNYKDIERYINSIQKLNQGG